MPQCGKTVRGLQERKRMDWYKLGPVKSREKKTLIGAGLILICRGDVPMLESLFIGRQYEPLL
jgi:hypothetical protein